MALARSGQEADALDLLAQLAADPSCRAVEILYGAGVDPGAVAARVRAEVVAGVIAEVVAEAVTETAPRARVDCEGPGTVPVRGGRRRG